MSTVHERVFRFKSSRKGPMNIQSSRRYGHCKNYGFWRNNCTGNL